MQNNIYRLYSATEIEELLGKSYFYRQRIYRLANNRKLIQFNRHNTVVFMGSHVIQAFLKELELRIQDKFPEIDTASLRIFYDTTKGKRIVVDGLFGRGIAIDTDEENEEDLLKKIRVILEWVGNDKSFLIEQVAIHEEKVDNQVDNTEELTSEKENEITEILPEEILYIRLDTGIIEGIEVKSYIVVSLPSIAQFVGIRPNNFIQWFSSTSFSNFILSAHYKQFQGAETSVPWKKGVVSGYTPFIPFEFLPEIIVSLRQSKNTPKFPEKAQMLYDLAKTTLEAVGLAVSGNRDKAAEALARVGQGLGLTAADQIIGLFKQYESRDFQIKTTKEFNGKVKELKLDYATTIGRLTIGITGRYPSQWKLLGNMKKLPKTITDSSREVMRKVSPSDSVGMAFGEKHFIKDPVMKESIETGRQGKDFYERLKKVGLLD
jgi:hypothetical protein